MPLQAGTMSSTASRSPVIGLSESELRHKLEESVAELITSVSAPMRPTPVGATIPLLA